MIHPSRGATRSPAVIRSAPKRSPKVRWTAFLLAGSIASCHPIPRAEGPSQAGPEATAAPGAPPANADSSAAAANRTVGGGCPKAAAGVGTVTAAHPATVGSRKTDARRK